MLSADLPGLASLAHKISGSAGTLGLRGIAEAAARIEAAAKGGDTIAGLVARLERLIQTTHEELVELGILQVR